MEPIGKVVESIAERLVGRGASEEDAREMAESRSDRLVVGVDGAVCALDRSGRVVRSTSAADYLVPEIVGNAPEGVFARRHITEEQLEAKRRQHRGVF